MTPLTRLITFLILCICVLTPIEAKTLRVGYIPSAPYVDLQNKEKPGIAIEIWDTVAKKNKWDYKLINEKDNVDTAIDNLKAKKLIF